MYSCRKVSILESAEPVFSASACNEYMQVIIGNVDDNAFDYYVIDWGDGSSDKTSIGESLPINKGHNYLSANSTQTIKVEGFFNNPVNCPKAGFKTIEMNGGSNYPTIKSLELSEDKKSVKLNFTGAVDTYDIYQRSASKSYNPSQIFKQLKPGTYQLNVVDTIQSCFRIFRNFGCKEGSGEVCTTKLNIKSSPTQNQLTWKHHPQNNQNIIYDLQIVNSNVQSSLLKQEIGQKINPIASPNNPFIDDIDCRKQYCYQIESKITGTIDYGRQSYSAISLSNKICINREKISASPIKDISVTVNDKALTDILYQDDSAWPLKREKYFLYKEEGNQYVKIDSSATAGQTFTDTKNLPTLASHCYKIQFRDECGSLSELSPPACSIFLTENAVKDLQWTAASPFALGGLNRYEVLALNEASLADERLIIKSPYDNTHHPDLSPYEAYAPFQIKAVSYTGKESRSNILKIPIPVLLYFPSAFSPNGDDINETFLMLGKTKRLRQFRLEVFNRWGNLVFSTDQVDFHWEGLEPAVYTFRLEAVLDNDSIHRQTGTFSIIR